MEIPVWLIILGGPRADRYEWNYDNRPTKMVSKWSSGPLLITSWWFQYMFYFHPNLGFPFWRAYSSNGLVQPPTRQQSYRHILGGMIFDLHVFFQKKRVKLSLKVLSKVLQLTPQKKKSKGSTYRSNNTSPSKWICDAFVTCGGGVKHIALGA